MSDPADGKATGGSAVDRLKRDARASRARADEWGIDVFLGFFAIVCIFVLVFGLVIRTEAGSLLWFAPLVAAAVVGGSFGLRAPGDRGRLALFTSVALIVLTLAADYVIGAFIATDEPTAKSVGHGVITSIEQHWEQHGRYPEELAAAGIKVPRTPMCSWRYEVREGGQAFRLDAEGYGFAIYFDSYYRCWYKPDF